VLPHCCPTRVGRVCIQASIRPAVCRWSEEPGSAKLGAVTTQEPPFVGSEDRALLALFGAIASGDRTGIARMLDSSLGLASRPIRVAASRHDSETYFLAAIRHYVYAGDTALHLAAAAYQREPAEWFVARGADVRARNRRGAQPLHAADGGPDTVVSLRCTEPFGIVARRRPAASSTTAPIRCCRTRRVRPGSPFRTPARAIPARTAAKTNSASSWCRSVGPGSTIPCFRRHAPRRTAARTADDGPHGGARGRAGRAPDIAFGSAMR
jgi:hypothetical protein